MEAVFKASALSVHSMYSFSSLKTIIHCAGSHSCILSVKHTHMHACRRPELLILTLTMAHTH